MVLAEHLWCGLLGIFMTKSRFWFLLAHWILCTALMSIFNLLSCSWLLFIMIPSLVLQWWGTGRRFHLWHLRGKFMNNKVRWSHPLFRAIRPFTRRKDVNSNLTCDKQGRLSSSPLVLYKQKSIRVNFPLPSQLSLITEIISIYLSWATYVEL